MTYTGGVIEQAINAIYTQLQGHQVTGGKLNHIKNIIIGSRKFDTGGWDTPLIVINPIGFSSEPKTTAGYLGENMARLSIEFRIVQNKLVKSDQVSKSTNVLYDGAGNGSICAYQDFCYCLMFSHGGATAQYFTPGLGLKLNKMPMPDYRLEDTENFVEIVCNVNMEYIYTYSAIAGSTV